jgi:hypothetical protein
VDSREQFRSEQQEETQHGKTMTINIVTALAGAYRENGEMD